MTMTITLAVPTRDRPDLLRAMARSLRVVEGLERCTVRVYDDRSEKLTRDEIAAILPEAAEIRVRDRRLGADGNMHALYQDFLSTGDDVLFAVDSDLVLHPQCLAVLETLMPESDGILSLYNGCVSAPFGSLECLGHRLLLKQSLGGAGVVFRRDLLARVIESVPRSGRYDIDWSRYLHEAGIRLLVTKQSYVQHLGVMDGFNAGPGVVEFGLNFEPGNRVNEAILADLLNRVILDQDTGLKAAYERVQNSHSYRLGHALLQPLRGLAKLLPRGRGRG